MYSLTPSTRLILQRWKRQAPEAIQALEDSGQLVPMLDQANEEMVELMYELIVIQKRDYQASLQTALEWTSLPGSSPKRQ